MVVFVSDTFTGSDGASLENHTPETGGTWARRSGGALLEIQSNKVEVNQVSDVYYTNDATPGGVEYDIIVDVTKSASDAKAGLLGRFTDMSNFYRGHWQSSSTKYRIWKKVGGSWTLLDDLVEDLPAGTSTLKLEIRSASKKLYLGAVEKATTADDTITDTGIVGIYFRNDATFDWTLDDFIADDVGGAVEGAAILTGVGSLVANSVVTVPAAVAMAGVGSLVVAGTIGTIKEGTAVLSGVGSLSAIGRPTLGGVAQLEGVGSLVAVGERGALGVATLSGICSLSAVGQVGNLLEGYASLAGIGSMSALAQRLIHGQVAMSGVGSLASIGVVTVVGAATLSGIGALSAIGETGEILYTIFGAIQKEIDPNDYPAGAEFKLEVILRVESGGTARARLYNITDAAPITGSELATSAFGATRLRSPALTLPDSTRLYRVEYGGTPGNVYTIFSAAVRVESA